MHTIAFHWIYEYPDAVFAFWKGKTGPLLIAARWAGILVRVRKALQPQLATSMYTTALVLTLGAVVATTLGLWRLSADLGWANDFPVAGGWMSRYQVWLAVAIGAQACACRINRLASLASIRRTL
jgi:hypothetical protein